MNNEVLVLVLADAPRQLVAMVVVMLAVLAAVALVLRGIVHSSVLDHPAPCLTVIHRQFDITPRSTLEI